MKPPLKPLGEDELEQPSEIRPATARELRLMQEASRKAYTSKDVQWFVGAMATVAVAAVSLVGYAQSTIRSSVDAGVFPVGERVTRMERKQEKAEEDRQRAEKEAVRQSTMLEMIVVKLRMTPPPEVDGGR